MDLIAHIGPVRQLLAYLAHIGIDESTLGIGHIDRKILLSSELTYVSARFVIELMEAAAIKSGQPDFGLRFVSWLNPRDSGPLSLALDHCCSLAEWCRLVERYSYAQNNAVIMEACYSGSEVVITSNVLPELRPLASQFLDALVATSVRSYRTMLGGEWNPERVEFPGPRIARSAYQKYFRCEIDFRADRHAIILSRDDFERRLPRSNPDMLSFLDRYLTQQAANSPRDIEGQVARIIASALPGKAPSLDHVATLLGTTPRTLQRRLSEQDMMFGEILKSVRIHIAEALLSKTPPAPLAQLAYELGYSEPSAACRFLRHGLATEQNASAWLRNAVETN